ncbi:MAG: MipA/OmpV family protein [Elusimicrobiales bacterium]|nr:MipA/OmpV family protein [Elusimicrobiales bacterium]
MYLLLIFFCLAYGNQLNIELGTGLIYSSSIYKSKQDRKIFIPFIKASYSKLSLYGTEVSYEIFNTNKTLFTTSLKWEPSGFDPDDGWYLKGMKKRKDEINIRGIISYRIPLIRLSFENSYNLTSSKKYYSFSFSISSRIPINKTTNVIPSIKVEYENKNKANYKYGVFYYEETQERKQYSPNDTIIKSLNLNLTKRYEKFAVIILNSFKILSKDVEKSPIISRKLQFTTIIGIILKELK